MFNSGVAIGNSYSLRIYHSVDLYQHIVLCKKAIANYDYRRKIKNRKTEKKKNVTITSEKISRSSSIDAVIFSFGPLLMAASLVLEYFLGRPRILPIIKETIVAFFRMVHKKKLLRRSRFKHRTCSESQYEVIYFVYVVKKIRNRYILCKNCSIHGKDCETSGPYNFHVQKSVKSNTTDV